MIKFRNLCSALLYLIQGPYSIISSTAHQCPLSQFLKYSTSFRFKYHINCHVPSTSCMFICIDDFFFSTVSLLHPDLYFLNKIQGRATLAFFLMLNILWLTFYLPLTYFRGSATLGKTENYYWILMFILFFPFYSLFYAPIRPFP